MSMRMCCKGGAALSLKPSPIQPVPAETARVARAAFPKGNVSRKLRDQLGPIFSAADFAALFPKDGQPPSAPWRLALVTVLPFREHLAARQAAAAVRARLDGKYLLGLELADPGFDFSVLSAFRCRPSLSRPQVKRGMRRQNPRRHARSPQTAVISGFCQQTRLPEPHTRLNVRP